MLKGLKVNVSVRYIQTFGQAPVSKSEIAGGVFFLKEIDFSEHTVKAPITSFAGSEKS